MGSPTWRNIRLVILRRSVVVSTTIAMILGVLAIVSSGQKLASASTLTNQFVDRAVLTGLDTPVALRFAPDGRVFVAEKRGVIKSFANANSNVATQVADLRTEVYNYWDRGLLGLALDPNFSSNRYVYVSYAYDHLPGDPSPAPHWGIANTDSDPCPTPPGDTQDGCVVQGRIARLTLDSSGQMIAGSLLPLVTDYCQQFPSHSMGALNFGADGYLYASAGDGASFTFADLGQRGVPAFNPCGDPVGTTYYDHGTGDSQGGSLRSQDVVDYKDPAGLDGTIIRINPATGAGVPGNPFIGSPDPNAKRIVAHGLRNPFRWTFRPGTNDAYIGDVGWGTWEEINRMNGVSPYDSANMGWPCYEGAGPLDAFSWTDLCAKVATNANAIAPLYAYQHGQDMAPVGAGTGQCSNATGSSTTGLAFYSGGAYPSKYTGALFMADYSRSCISVMFPDTNGVPDPSTVKIFGTGVQSPTDLQAGPGGDIFYISPATGNIYRIIFTGTNHAPVALIQTVNPFNGDPLSVHFSASGSTDADAGDTLTYQWDFTSDGTWDATGVNASFVYPSTGTYQVKLRVTDNHGLFTDTFVTVNLNNTAPVVTITAPTGTPTFSVGDTIAFSGTATDAQDGTIPPAKVTWTISINHCVTGGGCHTHPVQTITGVMSGTFAAPDHDYPSQVVITMSATDSGNAISTSQMVINPNKSIITYQLPAGSIAGAGFVVPTYVPQHQNAPATLNWITGSTAAVTAPSTLVVGGVNMEFDSWSDGAAQGRTDVPASSRTVSARYSSRRIAMGSAQVVEGQPGAHNMAVFPITVSPASSQNISIGYATGPQSATSPSDFTATSGTLVIPAGTTTASIAVPVIGDTLIELDESFVLNLFNNSAGVLTTTSAIGTIINDDGVAGLSVNDVSIAEGNSGTTNASITITLSAPASAPVSVHYATADGTATAGSDYTTTTGNVTFAPGETTKVVSIPIIADTIFEQNEMFTISLSAPTNAALLVTTAHVTILNDDSQVAPRPPDRRGYYFVAGDGGIFTYGDAVFYGSTGNIKLNQPVVGMALTRTGNGYYLVAADGGIFAFGDAVFHGSTGDIKLNKPVIGMAVTPSGAGYWLFASDGGVFAFGDAPFLGSTGAQKLASPVVGMAARPQADGYWLFSADGTIFPFGQAANVGTIVGSGRRAAGMAATLTGNGYWIVSDAGTVTAFGDAVDHGSTQGVINSPIVGISSTPTGQGYWLFAADGGVFAFGDAGFYGSAGAVRLNAPMVGGVGGFS